MDARLGSRAMYCLVAVFMLLATVPLRAAADVLRPGLWTKAADPVLDPGGTGAWDATEVQDPAVVFDGTSYRMWYTGWTGDQPMRIGYATSPDGLSWTRLCIQPGARCRIPPGVGTRAWCARAAVIYDGGVYRMWYTGRGAPGASSRIGYATSPDGITWTKYAGNPVLDVGAAGSWDAQSVVEPTVVRSGSGYKMWFRGRRPDFSGGIGYAISPDGSTWTRYAGNPVIADAPAPAWDYSAYGPSVIFDGTLYHLFYSGGNLVGTTSETGHAVSSDSIHWAKYGRVIQQGPDGTFDRYSADYAAVVAVGDTFKMWYSGLDANSRYHIGYASAPMLSLSSSLYLPVTVKNAGPCAPIWSDDFSDYHSGWPIDSQPDYEQAYAGGEYRLDAKAAELTPGLRPGWRWPAGHSPSRCALPERAARPTTAASCSAKARTAWATSTVSLCKRTAPTASSATTTPAAGLRSSAPRLPGTMLIRPRTG